VRLRLLASLAVTAAAAAPVHAQSDGPSGSVTAAPAARRNAPAVRAPNPDALKRDAMRGLDSMATFTQQMVDQIFSFGELGFHEVETSRYIVDLLRKNGFEVTEGTAGMPTGWVARWGSGKPVIALGSDIDGIPQASQKPGVAYRAPMIEGAPGHGEGHNSGQAVNIAAAIAVKRLMERERMPGTIVLWPGVAEELMAGKAFLVREGAFKDADVVLFSHVSSDLGVAWGESSQNALVSAEFVFRGTSAHAAGAPWRGKSALDAVQLMAAGWEYRREHLRLAQRSHYVIRDGGDQPNVVPTTASIWFYFRELDHKNTLALFEAGKRVAQGAAMMTDTELDTVRVLGSGWSAHFSKPVAEAMYENIKRVGMPTWDDKDNALAKGLQRELGVPDSGLSTRVGRLTGPATNRTGGGSDDIGDVSWNVPTVTLRFPANIPNLPGHNWSSAIAMATPIAHKGSLAGAKVQALTMIDILTSPTLVRNAWQYFREVQTKDVKYVPFISATDKPALELNADIMARYRPEMRKFYYDPSKYATYLEQLGITYPTVRAPGDSAARPATP
jgi:aminobenzoyl-glutamate utilization protein B